MKKLLALAVFTLAASSFANGKANYGMAGCGLGSMVFEGKNDKMQILAATTNSTFGSQTFGITFGTSNCGDSGALVKVSYIESNKEALKKDMARGSGETVTGLSQVMNCSNTKAFSATAQKNYKNIFTSDSLSASEINSNIQAMIANDQALKATCAASL